MNTQVNTHYAKEQSDYYQTLAMFASDEAVKQRYEELAEMWAKPVREHFVDTLAQQKQQERSK
jgi:hypothetical protein